jgi:hypothetical protein
VPADASALVLSPGLWVGTELIPLTTLNVVIQIRLLTAAPRFPQWAHRDAVPGWELNANHTASISTYYFQYDGWPYPRTPTGACF